MEPVSPSSLQRRVVEVPIWIAILAIGAFGVFLGFLINRRYAGVGAQIGGATPPIQINNYAGHAGNAPAPTQALATLAPMPTSQPASLSGLALPSPSTRFETFALQATMATVLFVATGRHRWRLRIRVVGPPGAFAIIAPDASVLTDTDLLTSGRSIIVPSGGDTEIFLNSGDKLYGRGSVANVITSITASVESIEAWRGG